MWNPQQVPEEVQQQLGSVYHVDVFPFEVRTLLAEWIDKQPWSKIFSESNPEAESLAVNLHQEYILKLNSLVNSLDNNSPLKFRLNQICFCAQNRNPMDFANIIYYSLQKETKIRIPKTYVNDSIQDITRDIQRLQKDCAHLEETMRILFQEHDQFLHQYQERQKYHVMLHGTSVSERTKLLKQFDMQDNFQQTTESFMKKRAEMVDRIRECSNAINNLMIKVVDTELNNWHRGQQLVGNGVVYTGATLDDIQDWCESLTDFIWKTRIAIKQLQSLTLANFNAEQYLHDSLASLLDINSSMLSRLVSNTFVIEKQPPQVMKTNTRFTATVRLLVGCKLNLHVAPPNVSAHIISEHQAALLSNLAENPTIQNESAAGEILNNIGVMEYHTASGHLSVHFRNMQLKKIKRTEKKGTESVMDEKFALLFNSRFTITQDFGDVPLRIPCCVQTFSLPVVVIVHGNQEPHAHATITWDNAFAEQRRTSFLVPDKVPFCRVGDVLSQKFVANVGKGLTLDNLRYLACKALRTNNIPDLNVLITWGQFSKEPLPDRNFTFWEWFYSVLKITKEHLRSLWNDDLIHGFVSRTDTAQMLSACPIGTFLLRFSDSEQGGLTVAWKGKSPEDTEECFMLQPFNAKDLGIRSLADRLNDLKHLTHLYPDTPKDAVFSKYYTPIGENTKTNTGYVKPVLITCVPGLSSMPLESFPNTPQSSLQPHSPSDSNSMPFEANTPMDCNVSKHNGIHSTNPFTNIIPFLPESNPSMVAIDFSNDGYNY